MEKYNAITAVATAALTPNTKMILLPSTFMSLVGYIVEIKPYYCNYATDWHVYQYLLNSVSMKIKIRLTGRTCTCHPVRICNEFNHIKENS